MVNMILRRPLILGIIVTLLASILVTQISWLIGFDPRNIDNSLVFFVWWLVIILFPHFVFLWLARHYKRKNNEPLFLKQSLIIISTILILVFMDGVIVSVIRNYFIISPELEEIKLENPENYAWMKEYFENLYSFRSIVATSLKLATLRLFLFGVLFLVLLKREIIVKSKY